jgi:hypothetical protein
MQRARQTSASPFFVNSSKSKAAMVAYVVASMAAKIMTPKVSNHH